MIRTVALGVVCLAGLGAIAAAAKKQQPPQPAEVVFPMVSGEKADRLPLIARGDTQTENEEVDVVYVPPVENIAPSNQSVPQKAANPPPPVSFLVIGTPHMTGSFSMRPSREPINQSWQRKAPLTERPNRLLT